MQLLGPQISLKIWSEYICIEIAYLHFRHIQQQAAQGTVLFWFNSSCLLPPITSPSRSWYSSHESVSTIWRSGLPLTKLVKKILCSKLRPLRCSSHGRKAPASHGLSKTHHCLVCLSIQLWLSDYKTDFSGCFVWELLIFSVACPLDLNLLTIFNTMLSSWQLQNESDGWRKVPCGLKVRL